MEGDALDRLFGDSSEAEEATTFEVVGHKDGEIMSESPKDQAEEEDYDKIFGDDTDDDEAQSVEDSEAEEEDSDAVAAIISDKEEKDIESQRFSRKRTLSDVRVREMNIKRLQAPRDLNLRPSLLKLPAFMGIQREEYSASTVLDTELADFEGNPAETPTATSLLLHAATTIRWRKLDPNDEASPVVSNSRLVQWSDGSWSVVVGDSAYFELSTQGIPSEQNFIFGRHPEEGAMECLGKLKNRLMIRPYITDDQSHRKYLAAAATTSKAESEVRVKLAVTMVDPELEKARMIKLEAEKIKARRKLEAKRRNLKQSSFDRVSRTGLTARFLEDRDYDEEEEEGTAIEEDRYEDDFIDDDPIEESEDEEELGEEAGIRSDSSGSASEAESEYDTQSFLKDRGSGEPAPKRGRRAAIVDDED